MKIFWSYAKLDNMKPHKLTKLREAFSVVLDETTGSNNKILVDEIDLQWGVQWKQEIEKLILSSDAMILILTPSYFNSRMCIYESKEEGNQENIALNRASEKLDKYQYRDFRKYRNKDLYSEAVQDFLDSLANGIV